MGLFMQYPGLNGDSTEKGYEGWITLSSVHFGSSRSVDVAVGSAKSREAKSPTISAVTVTKALDASSAGLFRASVSLSEGVNVRIAFTKTGGETYLKYDLSNVLIASYHIATDGDRPIETVNVSCAKFEMTVTTTDANNNPIAPMTTGYDLAQNAAL
jgi:type VI secretion system secreted protein Hcp